MAIGSYRNYPSTLEGIQRLNRMLDEAFSIWPQVTGSAVTSAWFPPTDVYEDKEGLEITMELPSSVDVEKVEARYENGVLFIRVPKAERAKPREIPVTAGQGQQAIGTKSQSGGSSRPAQARVEGEQPR